MSRCLQALIDCVGVCVHRQAVSQGGGRWCAHLAEEVPAYLTDAPRALPSARAALELAAQPLAAMAERLALLFASYPG